MTAILGISAFYHDSAAALVVDGRIVAAAQQERFSRRKHDESFPVDAIKFCLQHAELDVSDLDYVVFYEKPLLKFDRILESAIACAPRGFRHFFKAIPVWLSSKLHARREIRSGLASCFRKDDFGKYTNPICFCDHHESHAASAFFPSPFDSAAILTMDGVGEWATTTLGVGNGNRIELTDEIRFPHSLGLLYSAFTYYCGFRVNSGEYKLMGLAPYGEPKYADLILEHLVHLREDGSYRLDMSYFDFTHGLRMTSKKFHDLFGRSPRQPDSEIERFQMDLAASIQSVTEDIVLRTASYLHQKTGQSNLCLAGGVALNCVANGRLIRESLFDQIWVQPASGDAGGAMGAAMFVWHQLLNHSRTAASHTNNGSRLGPEFTDADISQVLDECGANYRRLPESELLAETSQALADGKVVGWMQGRMEFGPRALGCRSILGDPRSEKMQSRINQKIKFRESFRPFAPAVLREHANDYFLIPPGVDSPFMTLTFDVAESRRQSITSKLHGIEQVHQVRSQIPAVTHVDYSARVQTVDDTSEPMFRRLLQSFYELTGCPMLVNTSFNVRDEPIVCTPQDAYRCFMATEMDVLVIGSFTLNKIDQPENAK